MPYDDIRFSHWDDDDDGANRPKPTRKELFLLLLFWRSYEPEMMITEIEEETGADYKDVIWVIEKMCIDGILTYRADGQAKRYRATPAGKIFARHIRDVLGYIESFDGTMHAEDIPF